jgi:hypothetical protein
MPRPGPPSKLSFEEKQRLMDLYREGFSTGQLARMFGLERKSINYFLRRRGFEIRPRWPKRGNGVPQAVTNRERDELGIIVTLREQQTRALFSMHVPGKRLEALRWLAEKLDATPGDWRLLCYSTAETIAGDLKGARSHKVQSSYWEVDSPETLALGLIHRLDLLDPKLDRGPGTPADRAKRRRP